MNRLYFNNPITALEVFGLIWHDFNHLFGARLHDNTPELAVRRIREFVRARCPDRMPPVESVPVRVEKELA